MVAATMKVDRLRLENYRGFKHLELALEPDLTVIVGVNGAGKSSVLDALAVMLADAIERSAGTKTHGFDDLDVHAGETSVWAEITACFEDAPSTTWSLEHARKGVARRRTVQRADLMKWVEDRQRRRAEQPGGPEPLAVYYPTERTTLDVPGKVFTKHSFGSIDAVHLALQKRTVDFRLFFEWFREREDVENERRARESSAYRDAALEVVRQAISAFMPGVRDPRVQRSPQRFVVTKRGVVLEVDQLSDGERSVLALVGDLARRLAMAASHGALTHPAVVLIDEIELHLHPGLQRDVITNLRATFPRVQFVLTTHSPYVLSEVEARSVRLLRDFSIEAPSIETWGQEASVISRLVQGAPQRPREVEATLQEARSAIDRGDPRAAEGHVQSLRGMVGAHDPEVIRLESLLDLLAGT